MSDRPLPTPPVAQALVGVVLAAALLAGLRDVAFKVAPAASAPFTGAVDATLGPVQHLIGYRQWWTMFSPSPPRNSRGAQVEVMGTDTRWRVVTAPTLPGAGEVQLGYRRMGKFERNLIKDKDTAADLREAVARRLCASEVGGQPAVGVRITRVEKVTPPPGGAPAAWERRVQLEHWCR